MIAQRYIDNPHLLNGTKYDLRIHVLVTSVDPLHVYIYQEGHPRIAARNFKDSDHGDKFAHLTNLCKPMDSL